MIREKKFTPGPWLVNPLVAQVDEMPSTIPVCRMLWPTEDRTEAETEANANLIAAAPELLEALEEARGDIAGLLGDLHGHKIEDYDGYKYIDSAIKKAYGETE